LRLLILLAHEGFLKGKCGPRTKKFEHHCSKVINLFNKTMRKLIAKLSKGALAASLKEGT